MRGEERVEVGGVGWRSEGGGGRKGGGGRSRRGGRGGTVVERLLFSSIWSGEQDLHVKA